MFNFILRLLNRDRFGASRSNRWPAFRKEFLKGKYCALCGGNKKLELHHIKDFSHFPELELNPNNVIPLCEAKKYGVCCHLFCGHLGNYKLINPDVVFDSSFWYNKLGRPNEAKRKEIIRNLEKV